MLAYSFLSLAILAARSAAATVPRQAPMQPKLIPIAVGSMSVNTSLIFTPNDVKANPGDVLQFQFFLTNHTVTQAAGPASPCSPLQDTVAGALHSGFIPGAMLNGSDTVGAFDVMVQNTEPMYLYCAQGPHCQLGQVMVVNGKPGDLDAYKTAAKTAAVSTPGKEVAGGSVGRIPMANAIIPPA